MRSRCGFDHQAQKQAEADAKEVPNGGLWMRMDEDVVWGEEIDDTSSRAQELYCSNGQHAGGSMLPFMFSQ